MTDPKCNVIHSTTLDCTAAISAFSEQSISLVLFAAPQCVQTMNLSSIAMPRASLTELRGRAGETSDADASVRAS